MDHQPVKCPHCQNDDMRMLEWMPKRKAWVCDVCSKIFEVKDDSERESKNCNEDS
jgi:transposase-like protein